MSNRLRLHKAYDRIHEMMADWIYYGCREIITDEGYTREQQLAELIDVGNDVVDNPGLDCVYNYTCTLRRFVDDEELSYEEYENVLTAANLEDYLEE